MNERRTEERFTTADMASAGERRAPEQAVEGESVERQTSGEPREATAREGSTPLFASHETEAFRSRWTTVQTGFVDEPRRAVEEADALVAQMMKRLAEVFAEERANLERQWDSGEDISTEDLRVALQRYRSFFDRLLSI